MWQRLNIEIRKNNRVLANAYYHWSGYTSSSLRLTEEILCNIDKTYHNNEVVNAVRLLETTGALLTEREIVTIKSICDDVINFDIATHRNNGLISVSEEGIERTQFSEEARVEIHLDKKTINFQGVDFKTKQEFLDDLEEYGEGCDQYNDLDVINADLENIPFSEFPKVKECLLESIGYNYYGIKNVNGDVWVFIE